ncbi:MAG TPA: hypothetical protein VGM23_10350, partial [Armatimonadota bacterium]
AMVTGQQSTYWVAGTTTNVSFHDASQLSGIEQKASAVTGKIGASITGGTTAMLPTWWNVPESMVMGNISGLGWCYYGQYVTQTNIPASPAEMVLTIVPAAGVQAGMKRVAIVCFSGSLYNQPGAGTATITSVKVGNDPAVAMNVTATVPTKIAATSQAQAAGILVPVSAGQNIVIRASYAVTTARDVGAFLVFEK